MSVADIIKNTSSYYNGDVYGGLECLNQHSRRINGITTGISKYYYEVPYDINENRQFDFTYYTDLCQSG